MNAAETRTRIEVGYYKPDVLLFLLYLHFFCTADQRG
jgi:hypothetical protein